VRAQLALRPAGWVVLVLTGLHAATRQVYAEFDRSPPARATTAAEWLSRAYGCDAPHDPRGIVRVASLLPHLRNDLEPAAMRAVPGLAEVAASVRSAASQPFAMTGSGSTLYSLCDSEPAAGALLEQIAVVLQPPARAVAVAVG
jgi:4-diphosphocytidyl-2C-methyl-D-erythritol kinase